MKITKHFILFLVAFTFIQTQPIANSNIAEPIEPYIYSYGKSGLNKDLIYYKLNNPDVSTTKKILMIFAMHGYEGYYNSDGQILVDIAEYIKNEFLKNINSLSSYELYIVPCANPDGLYDGWTADGAGRCTVVEGYDINREWDFYFQANIKDPRNKTGSEPFTSKESQALRDLINEINPDILFDVQGWENYVVASNEMYKILKETLELKQASYSFAGPANDGRPRNAGMLVGWAQKVKNIPEVILVEFPPPSSDLMIDKMKTGLLKTLQEIMKG